LDVHATADGYLVVCHDATVDATTDGAGAIATMTLAQVQALDNAAAWPELQGRAPTDRSLGVATLDEVLDEFAGTILNLDIKQTGPDVQPYEAALAEALRRHGRTGDVIVASFIDGATDAFSAVAPEIPTSAGTMATALFWRAVQDGTEPPPMRHVALQVPYRFQDTVIVDEAFVLGAHRAGVAVHVWTIDEPDEMRELLDVGVDGIITDRPSVLSGVLRAAAS
jgi:glycerophosphoryl diester phosphodiesterase